MITTRKWIRIVLLTIIGAVLAWLYTVLIMAWNQPSEDAAEEVNNAIQKGDAQMVRKLVVENKSILRAGGIKQNISTPLNTAVWNDQMGMVDLLLSLSADINLVDRAGYTPLHCAVENGDIAMIKFLLNNGAKVNAKADGGVTPLHIAVKSHRKYIAEILLDRGADLTAKSTLNIFGKSTDEHYTPLQLALKIDDQYLAEFIQSYAAKQSESLFSWSPTLFKCLVVLAVVVTLYWMGRQIFQRRKG